MATTVQRNTDTLLGSASPGFNHFPMAATTSVLFGTIAMLDANGNTIPGATGTSANKGIGKYIATMDNTGASGSTLAPVEFGVHYWYSVTGSSAVTAGNVGAVCYVEDNETVTMLATDRAAAGSVWGLSDDGSQVGVYMSTSSSFSSVVGPTGPAGPTGPTGPTGPSACCDPDTMIATPTGLKRIAELVAGDEVISLHQGKRVSVKLRAVQTVDVRGHLVQRVRLETGRTLRISAQHPTADGRIFGILRTGDTLDGVRITASEIVPYTHARTHDILPDSDTGTYLAGGVLIGSTMLGQAKVAA